MTRLRSNVRKVSEMQMAVKNPFIPFIGYLSFFYLAWALVWVYSVYPWATRTIGDATLMYALINIAFRLLIWVLPVFLYLRYIDHVNVWEYLQLKQYWRRGVIVGLTISVINFLGMMVRIGQPAWGSAHVTWNDSPRTQTRAREIFRARIGGGTNPHSPVEPPLAVPPQETRQPARL